MVMGGGWLKLEMVLVPWFCMLLLVPLTFIELGACHGQGQGQGQDHGPCEAKRCGGNGLHIRFPFRLNDQDPSCGYPGFNISCIDNKAVLELPIPVKLYVSKIDYKSQEIHLYDPDNCLLKQLLETNLKLSSSRFNFASQLSDLTLFNCSVVERKSLTLRVPCLSTPAYDIYAVTSDSSIEYLPIVYCTKMYNRSNVPYGGYNAENTNNLILNWSMPICQQCERDGKKCRLKIGTKDEPECEPKGHEGNTPFSIYVVLVKFY